MSGVLAVVIIGGCIDTGLAPTGGPPNPPPTEPPDRAVPGDAAAPDPDERLTLEPFPERLPDAPPEYADFLFADEVLHRFDLTLSEEAEDALRDEPRVDVLATFTFGEESWDVGLRLKGSHSMRGLSEKPSFKIDFGEMVPDQEFHGLRRLTLNNMVQDPSMVREHTIYRAYRELGVPGPRHGYAEVYLNGEPFGVYGVLDTMDGRFAKRAFPHDDDGWLYEGGDGADLLEGRAERFQVQAEGTGEPWADLHALVAELDAADDVMDLLEERFDPSVFHMWATDIAAGHTDGYVRRRNNYLVYHGTKTDRWWMIPWGNDQVFREESAPHEGFFGRLLVDCQRSDACMDRLDEALRDVADSWDALALAEYAEATAERLAEACERDPRREDPCSYDGVVDFVAARPEALRDALD